MNFQVPEPASVARAAILLPAVRRIPGSLPMGWARHCRTVAGDGHRAVLASTAWIPACAGMTSRVGWARCGLGHRWPSGNDENQQHQAMRPPYGLGARLSLATDGGF